MEDKKIEAQIRSLLPPLIHQWSKGSARSAQLAYQVFLEWQALILGHHLDKDSQPNSIDAMLVCYQRTWAEFENLVRLQVVRWKMVANQSDNRIEARTARFQIAMWQECISIGSTDHLVSELNQQNQLTVSDEDEA